MEGKVKKVVFGTLIALMLVAAVTTPVLADNEQSTTASVTVNEVVSITLSGAIDFGSVTPPVTEQGTTGQGDGSPAITVNVGSETNINVDIGIKGTTSSDIALSNWKYSKLFDRSDIAGLTTSYVAVYTSAAGSSSNAFYHWITVPTGTAAGPQTATVSYKAVKTGTGF